MPKKNTKYAKNQIFNLKKKENERPKMFFLNTKNFNKKVSQIKV